MPAADSNRNVDWTVEGTHPLAGHYYSKADFLSHTFEKLAKVLPQGAQLQVQHALVSGDWAVVELRALASAQTPLTAIFSIVPSVRMPALLTNMSSGPRVSAVLITAARSSSALWSESFVFLLRMKHFS